MHSELTSLVGRDHLSFRSYYLPVKVRLRFALFISGAILFCAQSVIDGDLCEQYNSLDPGKKKSIANELERTPSEVTFINSVIIS